MHDQLGGLVVVFGLAIAVIAALSWHKHKALRLLPFAYAFSADIIFRISIGRELSLMSAIGAGALAYGIAWLIYLQGKPSDKD